MPDLHAVATGDIVASSELPDAKRRRLPEALRDAYAEVQTLAPEILPYDLAIMGGDGWQCYVRDPDQALPRILQFCTFLRADGLRSRCALAFDTVDFIDEDDLGASDGAAFRRSGHALQHFPKEQQMACLLPDALSPVYHLAAESLCELIDHLILNWTEAQAQAVAGMLRGIGTDVSITQEAIAEQWEPEPVTRQTVNRHLQRAYWPRLERTLSRFARLVRHLSDTSSLFP